MTEAQRKNQLGLLALAVGAFGIGATEFAPMGLLPVIARDLQVSIPAAGLLINAYALGVVLVGKRDGRHHARLAPQHAAEPVVGQHAAPDDPTDPAHRANDQQLADIGLAHLAYAAEPGLAAGRSLPWDQAEPRGEISAAGEGTQIGCQCHYRARGHRADPRHCAEPTHRVVNLGNVNG